MLSNLKISAKLSLLIAAFALAMLMIGGYAIHAIEQVHAMGGMALQMTRNAANAVDAIRAAEVNFKIQIQEFGNVLVRGHDQKDFESYLSGFKQRSEAVEKKLGEARSFMTKLGLATDGIDQALRLHVDITRQYLEGLKQFEPGKTETTQLVDGLVRGKDRPLEGKIESTIAVIDQFVATEDARVATAAQTASTSAKQWLALLIIGMLTAVLLFGVRVNRGVSAPIRRAVAVAEQVAGGDLTLQIEVQGRDEIAQLLGALLVMTHNLRQLMKEVAQGARTVADTSSQIAQGNLDLSQRTEEQATTLEETASSMEELTSTVAHNADSARQASQLAVNASEVARKGGQVVGQVVGTMTEISQSSLKISDIIGVIDGIAFQTNILALNAAVEAARAGEQGRGFAVVATEVRSLAQRSAAAAKEIKSLIGESVEKVEAGTKLVDSAGKTMEEIVASVKKVSDLIAEIAAASQEQSAGIGQVNTAVAQMEQVVQQNASLVEQASAATEAMKEQAAGLLQVVSRFELGNQTPAVMTPLQSVDLQIASTSEPVPIKARQSAALPSAHSGAIESTMFKPGVQSGQWEEF